MGPSTENGRVDSEMVTGKDAHEAFSRDKHIVVTFVTLSFQSHVPVDMLSHVSLYYVSPMGF